MKENIYSFIDTSKDEYPFFIEMTGISYCDGSYRIARNNSQMYVFEYIIEGQGTVKTDSKEFSAVKGDVYLLHKQSNHIYYSDSRDPWTKIWFNAKGPLIDSLIRLYKLNNVNHISNLDISNLFYRIFELAKTPEKSDEAIFSEASLVLHEIILCISKSINKNISPHSKEAMAIKHHLDKNYMVTTSLKELGELIYRSPSQTIRIFKKDFGITPYNYLINKKLEIAKLMLLNSKMSIKEIALNLCFADEHYFSNYFKAKIGVSPSKYRQTP